ncbi:MAG: GTP-binding protein [Clostridia bacterium]|nr:GTP-binding protein [Clostridia bacterium]
MVKINVISGFLGAGKTTLIKKLLTGRLRNEKVVLLENEYGEIGVDGAFLQDVGITVTELNAGCICCTLAGDFQAAIDQLIDTYHPERILIEPTGVGKLSEILSAVEKAKQRHTDIEVGGSATVVDAGKCRMYLKNFGEFFIDQVKSASTVIFSRTQLLSADRVEKSRALIAETHPDARIITTPWDDMEPDFILDVIENGRPIQFEALEDEDEEEHEHHHHHHAHDEHEHEHEHHDHDDDDEHEHEHEHHHHDGDGHDEDEHEHEHHDHDEHEHHHDHEGHEHHHHHHHHEGEHDADEVFQNIGVETAQRYTREEIQKALDQLSDEEEYGRILRAKGILQDENGQWFQFDYVPGECEFRDSGADYTGRFCVIGTQIDEKALRELFHV